MPKTFYYVLLGFGLVLGIILIIENMIGSNMVGYVLIWSTPIYNVVIFSIVCGILIGFGLGTLMNGNNDDEENNESF